MMPDGHRQAIKCGLLVLLGSGCLLVTRKTALVFRVEIY